MRITLLGAEVAVKLNPPKSGVVLDELLNVEIVRTAQGLTLHGTAASPLGQLHAILERRLAMVTEDLLHL